MRRFPAAVARANEHVDATAPRVAARAEVPLAQGVQIFAASAPDVGETLKALVRLFEPSVQPGATEETTVAVVLGDEAAEEPVEVLHRLDQAEGAAMPVVDGDVLEAQSQARGGKSWLVLCA